MMERYIIVGDIHGCFDELQALLKKVKYNKEGDILISVGDLMDRGPKSWEVLRFFMDLREEIEDRLVMVRGNHDQMFIDHPFYWHGNGNSLTYKSFEDHNDIPKNYIRWMIENTTFAPKFDLFNVVHAGVFSEDIAEHSKEDLLWDRLSFEQNLYNGKLFFIGHTPVGVPILSVKGKEKREFKYDRLYKLPKKGLLNIDTGCVYGGNLTAAIVQDDKVKFVRVNKEENFDEL